jgi:hypothetical protein
MVLSALTKASKERTNKKTTSPFNESTFSTKCQQKKKKKQKTKEQEKRGFSKGFVKTH